MLSLIAGVALAPIVQFGLRVEDPQGAATSALVLVRAEAGASQLPPSAVTANVGPDTWFVCDGRTRLDLPEGTYSVRVERGLEFKPVLDSVTLQANGSRVYRLQRWIDLAARGYRSGEDHLHLTADALPPLMRAAGLDFGTSLYWWNGPYFPQPAVSGEAAGVTLFDSEVENAWGALYSIGLRAPLPVAWEPGRSNLPSAQAAHRLGALNCYQGGWSREAVVDALLGAVDVINLEDNLFQRHRFMPRPGNGNLLGVAGFPAYPATDEGMRRLSLDSYYRLLNCGLRLAAGAGTAAGVKANAPGYNRAYVKAGPQASVRDFLRAWGQGRNFVTNGPMLFLSADGSREPGDTIAFASGGGAIHVRVEADSEQLLRSIAIIVNGRVVATGSGPTLDATVPIAEGSWIAATAEAEDRLLPDAALARYAQASRLGGEQPSRLRFAHTSPIYVTVGGAGARVARSVAEVRRLLAAFAVFARRTAAPPYQAEIIAAIAEARRRLDPPLSP